MHVDRDFFRGAGEFFFLFFSRDFRFIVLLYTFRAKQRVQ